MPNERTSAFTAFAGLPSAFDCLGVHHPPCHRCISQLGHDLVGRLFTGAGPRAWVVRFSACFFTIASGPVVSVGLDLFLALPFVPWLKASDLGHRAWLRT